jgi:hypothetical protein
LSVVPLSTDDQAPPAWWLKYPDGLLGGMFEYEAPPKRWHCTDRLLAGRAHALAGVGGSSKTTALYQLAIGSVLGRLPWDWEVSTPGSAALFLLEDTLDDVWRRLHLIGAGLDEEEREQLRRRLRVFHLAGKDARLLRMEGGQLRESEIYDWAMFRIGQLPEPRAFVGFDPALGITEGDEMNQAHQRRLGELMDRIAIDSGACVMVTTHAARNMLHADELGSHSSRGGGAITDAVRGEYALRTMTEKEGQRFGIVDRAQRQRYVQLAATKGNGLSPEAFAPLWLERGEHGLLHQVSLDQVERGTVGQRELQALELLRKAHESGETTLRFWREQCVAAGVLSGASSGQAQERAMSRIREALQGAGLVAPGRGRGLWVPT